MDSTIFFYILPVFCWLVLFIALERDRSRYRNCYFLFLAIAATTFALFVFAVDNYLENIVYALFFVTIAAILVVPFFLVHNGIVMFRREGHSLANLLSFVFGIIIGVGEIATFIYMLGIGKHINIGLTEKAAEDLSYATLFISVSVIYLSMAFLIFMIYSVFLMIIPRKKDFDFVIIHGAGLLDGSRVSKLLSDRIDKAIDVYRKDPTPPILIPSGGQGGDETISEAAAMKGYLLEKGIPEEKIIIEDQSATTFENLKNSKDIIDAAEGRKYTALVTSNYHVYRALRYCRKVGLKCVGIGSHVAFYYWPSALIREFIAVHAEKKHFLYLAAGWLICLFVVFVVLKMH